MANFQQTESAAKSLTQTLKELADQAVRIAEVNKQLSTSNDNLTKKTNLNKEAVVKIDKVERERLKLLEQLKVANSDRAQKNEEIRIQLQKQKKVNKELAKDKLKLIGAYEKESKRLNGLRKKYKDLAVSGKENTKQSKALRKEITKLDTKLKDVDSSVGQNQRNVGNYGDALGALPGPIGGVISSVGRLTKVLLANPLGILIAGLVAAGAALKSFFTNSEEGQDRWNKITSKSKVILGNFKDGLADVGKGLLDFTKNIKESEGGVKGWAKSIGERAKGAYKRFTDDVKDKGVWNALKDNATDAYESIKGGIKDITDENKREIAIAERLAEQQNKLDKQERRNLVETAILRRDISELRAKAADKEKTTAFQRIQLIDDAIAKQNEILVIEEDALSQRVYIAKEQAKLSGSTKEDLQEIAQLETQLINLQTTNAERRRRFSAEQQTAIREQKAELDGFISSIEAENKAFEDSIITANDDITKAVIENDKKVLDSAKKNIEFRKQAEEDLKAQSIDGINQLFDLRSSFRDAEIEGLEMQKEAEIAAAKEKGEDTVKIQEKFAKKEADLRKKQANQEKLQSLFNAGITIAEGIIKYSSNPLTLPLVPAFAALGALQLGAIAATPIPSFFKGVEGFEGGLAKVHSDEIIKTDTGEMFKTPKGETKMYLPPMSDVIPAHKAAPILEAHKESGKELKELKAINNTLSKQKQSSVNITDDGMKKTVKTANQRIEYIDTYMRQV